MDALEAIFTRRSIRKYTSQPIPEELIEQILKAAMYAPSADNQQPWHFVVIDDQHILDAITQFHPYAQMLKSAPLAIAVIGGLSTSMLLTLVFIPVLYFIVEGWRLRRKKVSGQSFLKEGT